LILQIYGEGLNRPVFDCALGGFSNRIASPKHLTKASHYSLGPLLPMNNPAQGNTEVPDALLGFIRSLVPKQDTNTLRSLRHVVTKEQHLPLDFCMFAISGGGSIVRPGDVRGRRCPDDYHVSFRYIHQVIQAHR
jgi:hypothetical protein